MRSSTGIWPGFFCNWTANSFNSCSGLSVTTGAALDATGPPVCVATLNRNSDTAPIATRLAPMMIHFLRETGMYFFGSKYFFHDFNSDLSKESLGRVTADQNKNIMIGYLEEFIGSRDLNTVGQNAGYLRSTDNLDPTL